jgi:hypothetical protein
MSLYSALCQNLRGFFRAADLHAVNGDEAVAFVDPGLLGGASRSDVGSHGNGLIRRWPTGRRPVGHHPIHPGDAIVGPVDLTLLLEIERRSDHCRHGDDHQQSVR